jgi:hypothetical protein
MPSSRRQCHVWPIYLLLATNSYLQQREREPPPVFMLCSRSVALIATKSFHVALALKFSLSTPAPPVQKRLTGPESASLPPFKACHAQRMGDEVSDRKAEPALSSRYSPSACSVSMWGCPTRLSIHGPIKRCPKETSLATWVLLRRRKH